MKGRVTTTLLAVCFCASLCFSQMLSTDPGAFGVRSNNPLDAHGSHISGVVVGSDGAPQADVRVEIRSEQTGSTIASGYTNTGGAFEFDGLPLAAYEVVASHGLAESRERLALGDIGINLKIRLNTRNADAAQADGNATVSIAEYKVPQKARDAFHKAEAALAKHRDDEVTKQLSKALEIYPEYAAALTLRGVLCLDAQTPQRAIDDFDKAIHSDPSYALAYTGLAAALNRLEKFDDALRSASRATALAPRSWQSYFEMAKSYVGKADYEHALQQLTKAQALTPTEYAPIHLVRAHVMLALKNYSNAVDELQAFLTLAPKDPNSNAARETLDKVRAFTATAANAPIVSSAK
jgi:tetratricopeptide (TPR) repeat protein